MRTTQSLLLASTILSVAGVMASLNVSAAPLPGEVLAQAAPSNQPEQRNPHEEKKTPARPTAPTAPPSPTLHQASPPPPPHQAPSPPAPHQTPMSTPHLAPSSPPTPPQPQTLQRGEQHPSEQRQAHPTGANQPTVPEHRNEEHPPANSALPPASSQPRSNEQPGTNAPIKQQMPQGRRLANQEVREQRPHQRQIRTTERRRSAERNRCHQDRPSSAQCRAPIRLWCRTPLRRSASSNSLRQKVRRPPPAWISCVSNVTKCGKATKCSFVSPIAPSLRKAIEHSSVTTRLIASQWVRGMSTSNAGQRERHHNRASR